MNDNPKLKKIIAKEVLFFFAAVTLVGLVWCVLLLRNSYLEHSGIKLNEEIVILTKQLDTFPKDKIKAIYDGLSKHFVVNYKIENDASTCTF